MRRGLLALIGSSVAIFWPGALIFGFPGVMAPIWKDMLGVGRGAIGSIMFFILSAVGIFMFLVGKWQEKLGIRKIMLIGSVTCSLSLLIILKVTSLVSLYLWAFIIGASSCFIYIPALTTVQGWFPERRGLVSGIVNLTFGISAAIMSPLFSRMLSSMGYNRMILTVMVISFITGVVASQFTEAPWRVEKSKKAEKIIKGSLTARESVKTRSFWMLWIVWALQGAAGISMVMLSVPFGVSIGMGASAVSILTVFNLTNGISRLISGYISDKIGRVKTMSIFFLLSALSYFSLTHTPKFMVLIPVTFIGFAFGTLFAVSAPLVSECFGLGHFGTVFGAVFTAYGFISGIIGPSLSGYLLDATKGNFGLVFIYLGIFCFVSSILINSVKKEVRS